MEFKRAEPFEYKHVEEYVVEAGELLSVFLEEKVPEMLSSYEYDSLQMYFQIYIMLGMENPDLQEDRDVLAICYNGFRLGCLIADHAMPTPLEMTLEGIIYSHQEFEEQNVAVDQAINNALSSSPTVDGLIGQYCPEIDTTADNRYHHLVEKFAGFALAMIENGERLNAINSEVGNMAEQLAAWEGEV